MSACGGMGLIKIAKPHSKQRLTNKVAHIIIVATNISEGDEL
jgi:hypothetical protein